MSQLRNRIRKSIKQLVTEQGVQLPNGIKNCMDPTEQYIWDPSQYFQLQGGPGVPNVGAQVGYGIAAMFQTGPNPSPSISQNRCWEFIDNATGPLVTYTSGMNANPGGCCDIPMNVWTLQQHPDGCCPPSIPDPDPCADFTTHQPVLYSTCCEWCEENLMAQPTGAGIPPEGCYDWMCDCCKPKYRSRGER